MKKLMLTVAFLPLLAACWGKKNDPVVESTPTEPTSEQLEQTDTSHYKEILAEESDDNVDEK